MSIWGTLLKGLTGQGLGTAVVGYFQRRSELKAQRELQQRQLESAVHERQMALISQGLAADATWELESLKAHSNGWKDEFVLLIVATPFALCFVPVFQGPVLKGFEILQSTPLWYRTLVVSIFFAVYGIRWWRRQQSDT